MKYITNDGKLKIEAADDQAVIVMLRRDSFNPEGSLEAFARATARAANIQTGKKFTPFPYSQLVQDLVAAGLLIPVE